MEAKYTLSVSSLHDPAAAAAAVAAAACYTLRRGFNAKAC